jgi:hypothetical protein
MRFEIEWLDAPGVRDPVLAATWARLRLEVNGSDVLELIHLPSKTSRAAVYGPLFPLVEWFVENWWSLLYEASPTSPLTPGRHAPLWKRAWMQRHNLLAAREGMALPDATFVRDGDDLIVRWDPDPEWHETRRVRFIGSGQVRVHAEQFAQQVTTLVEATLQRLQALLEDNEDVQRLANAWTAIHSADTDEQTLCRSLAVLGVDPYDPDQATDDLVSLVAALSASLPASLRDDLLEGSSLNALQAATDWLMRSRDELANDAALHAPATLPCAWSPSAHQTGYVLARQTRDELLGLDRDEPIHDLEAMLVERLNWDSVPLRKGSPFNGLDGLVGLSTDSVKPVLIDAGTRSGYSTRFLLARSAFFTVSGALAHGRLLTRAVTRDQRAARAFAAELLAPASAIAARVGGIVSQEEVTELSEAFGVHPLLIEHQIENHALGAVHA